MLLLWALLLPARSGIAGDPVQLSPEERHWVEQHPQLTFAIDHTYPPLNYLDDDGKLVGLSVDFIRLFAKKIGIRIEFNSSIWSTAITRALDHEVDGIVNADATEKRKAFLNFTKPYVTLPCGLVTLDRAPELELLAGMDHRVICAKKNSSHLELVKTKTTAVIHPVTTLEEGLEQVLKGKAFGVFDDISVLGFLISKYNFINLKINLVHHDDIVGKSRLGLRNDDPVMLAVFNKAISGMTHEEMHDIQYRWLHLVNEKTIIEKEFDWGIFLKISLPALFLIFLLYISILLHNDRLRRAVKKRTRDLEKSREQFKALIDNAADAVLVHDLSGRFLIVNQQACQSLGYTSEELLQLSVEDIESHTRGKEMLERLWARIISEGPLTIEGLHRRKDGGTFPVELRVGVIEASGKPAILALARNIQERKQKEHQRSLLAEVLEQSHETVLITDSQGYIQYVNSAFERTSGYSKDEVAGKTTAIFNSGRHSKTFYRYLWHTIRSGNVWRGLIVSKCKDGTLIEEEAAVFPVKDTHGDIVNYAAVMRDLTQEKNLERRLLQAQKMEAIGTLAGGIAHDFNNILSAIIGYAELLQVEIPKESDLSKYSEQILKAGSRAKNLVLQILTFSRQTDRELKPASLKFIAKEALKLLRASLPATIEIHQDLISDALVMGDSTQLHQIIMNLCTNAGHAMQENGGVLTITLTDEALDLETAAIHTNLKPGKYLKLTVTDSGFGIPADRLNQVFDPFFTTKEKGKGTGLGLAVVHGIVKSYMGTIKVSSELGSGTTFEVLLPAVEASADLPDEKPAGLPSGTERILLVDDEPELVDIEKNILERLGYQVDASTSATEVLGLFQSNPEKYDLVLTDMTMPEMTGDKLAAKLIEIRKNIPIILITGFSAEMTQEKALSLGIKGFLMKPVVRSELAEMVRAVLDG